MAMQSSDFDYFSILLSAALFVADYKLYVHTEKIFAHFGIPVICNYCYLGRFLCEPAGQDVFVQEKIASYFKKLLMIRTFLRLQRSCLFSLTKFL